MSCDGEESSMDEDEDMPGLESVSSSEYVSDEDSVGLSSEEEEKPPPTTTTVPTSRSYTVAKKWLDQTKEEVESQLQVITIHLLSPFLYGRGNQKDRWMYWCCKVGLLQSEANYNTEALKDVELCAVYVLDRAIESYKETATKEGTPPTNLAELIQLAEEVKSITDHVSKAVQLARKRRLFMTMLESVRDTAPKTSSGMEQNQDFLETACLYVIAQIAKHIETVVNTTLDIVRVHEDCCHRDEAKYSGEITRGDNLREQGRMKESIAQYATAVGLCQFSCKLYMNRAQSYTSTKNYRAVLSDGLRAVYLKPGWSKCHVIYIQGLEGCGLTDLASLAKKRYALLFPGESDNILDVMQRTEPTNDDHYLHLRIMKKCKLASEGFRAGDLAKTLVWYKEAWTMIREDSGWKRCMDPAECDRFMVALHYTHGSTLLEKQDTVSTENSLTHFEAIMNEYSSVKFPGVYYRAGRAYAFIHQHSDAVAMAKLGLEMVAMTTSSPPLYYPGTKTVIEDSKNDVIEEKLKKLLQQCKTSAIPDAVCRYVNCLSHNPSRRIWSSHIDYRGHVSLECHEDCSIAYHQSCWRKYKNDCEQKTDKDFLLTPCATPDCSGFVKLIIIFDNKGKHKARFEATAESLTALTKKSSDMETKAPLPSSSSSASLTGKKGKRRKNVEKESDKPSPVTDEAKSLVKEERKKSDPTEPSVKVKDDKGENVSSEKCEWEVGEKGEGEDKTEDVRRAEDSLKVINRQRETEAQEVAKQKVKKKKVKKAAVTSTVSGGGAVGGGGGEKHWNDLFTLPEREGMVGEAAAVDNTWQPDPQAPFQMPSHLREAVAEFERSQVPEMGLRSSSIPSASDSVPYQNQQSSEDLEFVYSFFVEIIKTHGPLKPSDPTLAEGLSLLPEEKKTAITKAGGIGPFLVNSPTFCSHEGLICLTENSPVVKEPAPQRKPSSSSSSASLSSSSGSSSSVSETSNVTFDDEQEEEEDEEEDDEDDEEEDEEDEEEEEGDSSSYESTTSESSLQETPSESPKISRKAVDNQSKTSKDKKPAITGTKSSGSGGNTANSGSTHPSVASSGGSAKPTQTKTSVQGSGKVVKTEAPTRASAVAVHGNVIIKGAGAVHRAIQTDRVRMTDQWVMTDPMPTLDSFKERYEMVLREKIDLRAKLEESEDRRFKIQKDNKREMDKLAKAVRAEAKEEVQAKTKEMEVRVQEERNRGQLEKKELADQTKALKAEIKSLSDKIERLKKDIAKKEQKLDSTHLQHQTELERLSSDHRKLEERLRLAQDQTHLATQRAITAEVDILQLRVENVKRPGDARLAEIDRICNHIPPSSDLHREWLAYQEKLRTALECFQMATEEQIQAVKAGRELSTMDKIPNPSVPLPAHLAFRGVPLMRPPFPGPMRMPMRGPPLPVGVRPMLEGQPPLGFPGGHPGMIPQPHRFPLQHQPHMEAQVPGTMPAALPHQGVPDPHLATANLLPPPQAPPALPSQPSLPPQPPTVHQPHPPASSGGPEGDQPRSSKSSFDRIVEKLVPHYPNYAREDFKIILREVRRNNRNTLSGLSLDSIADQVRSIIEARERAKAGGDGGSKVKPRPPLPPVAQAPPPVNTSAEYNDEWSCVICYEDMDATDSSRLMCGHRFHTECIKSWFKEQNTCPTCRNYALLPDEYPFLGH